MIRCQSPFDFAQGNKKASHFLRGISIYNKPKITFIRWLYQLYLIFSFPLLRVFPLRELSPFEDKDTRL